MTKINLDLTSLNAAYDTGVTPTQVVEQIYCKIEHSGIHPVWISVASKDHLLRRAAEIEALDRSTLPLYGVPFAVKDNIDAAGFPTTAACPEFSYTPEASATVVQKLEEAGAIVIGKTNLDQFATGLVGVRSPYGVCSSVFDPAYISGGSSSGSAVAVASGLVTFALGTDTAGSGRVPAAFNNLIGLKPTRGVLSAKGVVPACRSLDCVSIFSLTSADAAAVFSVARGFDPADPYSRPSAAEDAPAPWLNGAFNFGVPRPGQLEFFADDEAASLYDDAILTAERLGGTAVEIDFQPFLDTASLLYAGPWVAERLAAIHDFYEEEPDTIHPVVRRIIGGAQKYSAVDAFDAQYRLNELRRSTEAIMVSIDVLLLPTTGTTYTIEQVMSDPVRLNTNLGYYTNFVNLLDMAAVAVPAGLRSNGLPFGVTVLAAAQSDLALLHLADRLHHDLGGLLGGLSTPLVETEPLQVTLTPPGCTLVAVVGAHLTGQPLNRLLTSRSARLVSTTRTAACYRFYALNGTVPPKPGLVRDPNFVGAGIEVEVWAIPTNKFGAFVAEIPAPLGIGTVELEDGTSVKGFICEPAAIASATDITHFAGWRAYLASK